MYCKRCGKELKDEHKYCPYCGEPVDGVYRNVQQEVVVDKEDKGGFLWGLLGFLIPIVGLILYIVWKKDKPKTARVCGKGALISVIVGIILNIIAVILVTFMVTDVPPSSGSDGVIFSYIVSLL